MHSEQRKIPTTDAATTVPPGLRSDGLALTRPFFRRILRPSIVCAGLVSVALVLGTTSIAASFLPFDFLHAKARALSRTGQIPFFTQDFYRQICLRLRFIGAACLTVAAFMFVLRRRVRQFLETLATDAVSLAATVVSECKSIPALDRWALAAVILLAAFLRIPLLSQPMRYDEASTITMYASKPLYVGLSFYTEPNNHLFHTFLVHLTYVLFGNRPWALRLPAFLAGLLLVPATYAAARSLYRTQGAILAAALTATSSVLIEYSTSARGYTLVCFLFMILIPLAAYLLRTQNWVAWFLFAILSAIGFHTIPIMLYPLGGVTVWLLLSAIAGDASPRPAHVITGLLAAGAFSAVLTTALYCPVFAVSGPKSVFANRWVTALPWQRFLRDLPASFLSTGRNWNRELPLPLIFALAAGFAISLLWHARCSRFHFPLPLALAAWVVPLLMIQRVVPFERVWMFALPLFLIAAAAGLALIGTQLLDDSRLSRGMVLVAIFVSLWTAWRVQRSHLIYSINEGRGMEAIATYLKPRLVSGDSVLVSLPSDVPLEYHFLKQRIPIAYLNAPVSHRIFVVVNQVADDTLPKVFTMEKIQQPAQPVSLVAHFDSASLYEISIAK